MKIEIEFPEFVTRILSNSGYTPDQGRKILQAFTEEMLGIHNHISLQADLHSFIDDIVDTGEEDDILNS